MPQGQQMNSARAREEERLYALSSLASTVPTGSYARSFQQRHQRLDVARFSSSEARATPSQGEDFAQLGAQRDDGLVGSRE